MPHICPQIVSTSVTQAASQDCVQQAGSISQIWVTHLLHSLPSGGPAAHGSCEQAVPPQIPSPQIPLQHWLGDVHDEPFGEHPPQMPSRHVELQHCDGSKQGEPSGMQASTQVLLTQANEQHSCE